jgi:two-component system OmpR family sensor kinase
MIAAGTGGTPMLRHQKLRVREPLAQPSTLASWRASGEMLAVLGASMLGALLLHAVQAGGTRPLQGQASLLLAAATAGAAAAVALLCALNSRIRADSSMQLIGYAWACYGVVVMPVSVLDTVDDRSPILPGATGAVTAIFLALLALGFTRRRPRWLSGPRVITGAIALTALVIAAAAVLPAAVAGGLDAGVTDAVLLAGWGVLACGFVTRGLRRRSPVWWRMGFGLMLVAAAHMLLLLGGSAIEFAVLRFIAFVVLLAALSAHTRTLVCERRTSEADAAEAAAAAEHTQAERRHEMRNALTTLSAVTTLMAPRPEADAASDTSITEMIEAEFARLRALLEDTAPSGDPNTAAVDTVLARLVTLRRSAGTAITLDAPHGIVAELPAATLAQVVTNLLANCARHAAGAEVHVAARPEAGGCVVEVTDAGPGIGADAGAAPTAGDGLGLALSAQLLEAAGGSLELRAATRYPSGTTALLHLPLAAGTAGHLATPASTRRAAS